MKTEVNLFDQEVPNKKIKEWKIDLPLEVAQKIRERYKRVYSAETKHTSGGYQGLVVELNERLEFESLFVDKLLIGGIFRQAYTPSGGGWETECRKILSCISDHFRGEDYDT